MDAIWQWDELARYWNSHQFDRAHDWLNGHWSQLIQSSPLGERDPEAQFLQGIAYAALALHFNQHHNLESALLLLDDALLVLPAFDPGYLGVSVVSILDSLHTLRPQVVAAATAMEEGESLPPFIPQAFELERGAL